MKRRKICEMFSEIDPNIIEHYDNDTGKTQYNAVYTITLAELMDSGVFDWSKDYLNWKSAAYDDAQYARVCEYFEQRFRYREISMEPFKEWAITLRRKLVFELMPKYRKLYDIEDTISPITLENEYHKYRKIESSYPETMLSGNSDYASNGIDTEEERVKEGKQFQLALEYMDTWRSIDESLLDELECMFISMYTTNVNTF